MSLCFAVGSEFWLWEGYRELISGFVITVGGVPMPRMTRANSAENPEILTRRTRSLSMEEADKPLGIYSSSPGRVASPIKLGTSPGGKGGLSTSPPS